MLLKAVFVDLSPNFFTVIRELICIHDSITIKLTINAGRWGRTTLWAKMLTFSIIRKLKHLYKLLYESLLIKYLKYLRRQRMKERVWVPVLHS